MPPYSGVGVGSATILPLSRDKAHAADRYRECNENIGGSHKPEDRAPGQRNAVSVQNDPNDSRIHEGEPNREAKARKQAAWRHATHDPSAQCTRGDATTARFPPARFATSKASSALRTR